MRPIAPPPLADLPVQEKLAILRRQLAGAAGPATAGKTITVVPAAVGKTAAVATAMVGGHGKTLSLGLPVIDAYLGGGLMQAALHEIAGAGSDSEMAILPAVMASQLIRLHPDRRVIWIAATPDLHGPGLQALGLDPTRLLMVEAHQDADSLWALEEAARSGAVSLVIGEIDMLDLTASRRLQLAAEEKHCTILALRRSRLALHGNKHRQPSAAMTRWQISPMPSRLVEGRPGLGPPCWRLHLWRQRNGPPGCWDITLQDRAWQLVAGGQAVSMPGNPSANAANDDGIPDVADHHATHHR